MKNLFKKIIILTYITTFLFGIFIPFKQSLAISSPICTPPMILNDDQTLCVNPPTNTTDTTYTPLAPLPGMGLDANGNPIPINTDPGCNTDANGVKTCTNPCPFGNYLNMLIKVIIGFAAVLAMVMIVTGGIEYMTSELVSGKEAGRETITNAVLGLLIALGAFLILNTINPQLLNACLNNLPQATITIDPEQELIPWSGSANLSSPSKTCTEGYTNVADALGGTINVCKSISTNLNSMIIAAKNSNPKIVLSGSGSRTYDQQVTLRNQHGCPAPTTPPNSCTPETARPGYSKHESGKAIDFKCNGGQMKNSACFTWLTQNASKYGFYNLASEPWHWSDDGH